MIAERRYTGESKVNAGNAKSLSKRQHEPLPRGNDGMYARLRRLEQRIERIESAVSTIRRDVYRIEKKQQRELVPLAQQPEARAPAMIGGIEYE